MDPLPFLPAPFAKTRFFVIEDNTFGLINPRQPHLLSVLASKPSKGASHSARDGMIAAGGRPIRPATLADFNDYRVSTGGYDKCPDTEMPQN